MDLVTFGEAMVRLSPSGHQRLEQARVLDVHVGGGELNVAVAAARLGLTTRWVSALTDNSLGRMIGNRAREQGVDVSHVTWTDGDRAGLYFVEVGAAPRPSTVLYDRAASAMSRIVPGTIDWAGALDGARWFHTSGITPALSASAAATTAEALAAARGAGMTVSYDLNFRGKLWASERARAVQEPLIQHVDLLITTEDDARTVFGVGRDDTNEASPDAEAYAGVARALQDRFNVRGVAITLRDNPRWGALVFVDGAIHSAPRYEVEVVDRIGAGDAFSAGLIFAYLTHGDWAKALQYGVALAALKHTVPGDFSQATLGDVEHLLAGGSTRVQR